LQVSAFGDCTHEKRVIAKTLVSLSFWTCAAGPLAFLANSPEFMQMRAIVQTTPQALGSLLTELGRQNPAILQVCRNSGARRKYGRSFV
jgi:hypothetical protein